MGRPKKEKPNHGDLFEVKVTIGRSFDGSLIRKSFYSSVSKADARAKAEQYKINQAVVEYTGEPIRENTTTFETWAKQVLKSLRGTVKDNTYHLTYRNSIENHLIPYFGKHRLAAIRQIDIQNYFTAKGKELTLESLKKHKMALNRIFEAAELNGIINKNPCISIKLKSNVKSAEKHVYTKEQYDLVVAYTKTHRYGLGVYLMLVYGISRSELLGIRWDDIDAEHMVLHICRGVTDVQDGSTRKMRVEIGEPKNDFRKRDIPLSADTIAFLYDRKNDSNYVICNQSNTVCSPRTWNRRHYDIFMRDMHDHYAKQKLNIPVLTPHELRHTRASIWVNDGENIFAVADVLGHADLKMLRKRYAHSDVESTRKLLNIT